jgi:zinc transport system substrate-binding protein
MVFMPIVARVVVGTLAAASALAGCTQAAPGQAQGGGDGTGLRVATSFYPLQFVSERVAGEAAEVRNLTKPGAEPHDLELTPRDVAEVADADLVVFLRGFQPAVDTAVSEQAGERSYDVTDAARLDPASDPHFWLDPLRLADVADGLAERLAELAPDRAADFARNAQSLRADLVALDGEFSTGLATCASSDLVTSHAAFGYLAARYGFTPRGVTGLTPDEEPSPGALAELADFVEARGVRTVYSETLVSPAVAETLARETGVRTAVLDPLEGLDDASAGDDYVAVMRANLATLREGQGCR